MWDIIKAMVEFFRSKVIQDLLRMGTALYFDVIKVQLEMGESGGDKELQKKKHLEVRKALNDIIAEQGGIEWPSFLKDQESWQNAILDGLIRLIVYLAKSGK